MNILHIIIHEWFPRVCGIYESFHNELHFYYQYLFLRYEDTRTVRSKQRNNKKRLKKKNKILNFDEYLCVLVVTC